MATITVQASGTTTPSDWTLSAGASKQVAVNQPDDDATTYISSTTTTATQQWFTCSPALSVGDVITAVTVYVRAKRGGASDVNFIMGYEFAIDGGGTYSAESVGGALTATTNYANYSFTDTAPNDAFGSAFKFHIRNTQARNLYVTTFYVEITYTPGASPQTLTGAHIASTATVYAVSKVSYKLTAPTIGGGATVYAPSKISFKLAAPTITSGATLYAPAKLSRTMTGATIATTAAVYAPSSVTIADAPTTLTGVHIASTAVLYAPANIGLATGGAHIASTAVVNAGMVHRGSIHIVNVTTYAQGDVSSASFEHTTPAGDDRMLVVVATYYDTGGVASLIFGSSGTGDGQFSHPRGVAVAADGSIYVADTDNDRIQKFDAAGMFVSEWGTTGTGDGQFAYPYDVAVGPDGSVYVTDNANNRVQKFDAAGTFILEWGSAGSGDSEFSTPTGIAVAPDGSIYVADAENVRIQKFDAAGVFVLKWGSSGVEDGELSLPSDVAVGPDGSVYVTDSDNNIVQKFTSAGVFVAKWGSDRLSSPRGVIVTTDGLVYVADSNNNRISVFEDNGTHVKTWGSYGTGDGQFSIPYSLAAAADGSVYVADSGNNRIQVFAADLSINTASYNGVDMEIGPQSDSGSYFQSFYFLSNPPVGTYTVALVSPTEPNAFILTALSLVGVETALTDYSGAGAGRAEQETSTSNLIVIHDRAYPANTLSLWALLYETAGTTLTAASGNFVWFSRNVGTLTNTIGLYPIEAAVTENKSFGATASPVVTPKISAVLHLEAVRENPQLPAWATTTTLYTPARVALEGQVIDGSHIATTAVVYAPAMVVKILTAPTIASTAVVRTPSKVNHRLGGATLTATALYAPSVGVGTRTLTAATIAATTTLYAGALVPGGVTLAGQHVALSPTVYTPAAVTPGGVFILARRIDMTTVIYTPSRVINFRYLAPPAIESTAVLYAPAGAAVRLYIYAPLIGLETPMAINSPAFIDIATLYAMVLRFRIYGASIGGATVVNAPVSVVSGPRVQTGDVFPPVEVEVQ